MVALALLFIVIIGLLLWIVRLLQDFFKAYNSLNENAFTAEFEDKLQKQKNIISCQERNSEINTVINKRLTELDQKFPASLTQIEHPEMLTSAFKQALHSSLNLLKETEYKHKP